MTTSGTTIFASSTEDIIKDAFADLNVTGVDEVVSAEDGAYAKRKLNRMAKAWQQYGLHLWKKKTGTVFLQKDQLQYDLSSTGDHATESYIETKVGADEAIGQTNIEVLSSAGMSALDYIGIEQDDNTLHWSTIASIPDSTHVIINDALTVASASNSKIYAYTTRMDEPVNVYSMVRESETDIPMNYLSYEEYFQLPNKTSKGTPVSYNYDRQLNDAVLRVWPVPQDVEYILKITYAAKIQDFNVNSDTPDFPQEWEEAIVANLSVRMAPAYGKANDSNFIALQAQAKDSLAEALGFDNEPGSIYLMPDFRGTDYA